MQRDERGAPKRLSEGGRSFVTAHGRFPDVESAGSSAPFRVEEIPPPNYVSSLTAVSDAPSREEQWETRSELLRTHGPCIRRPLTVLRW